MLSGVVGRAGFGLKCVKMFRADFRPAHNFCVTFRTIYFLLIRTFVVFLAVTSVSEVIVIFLQLILFANTAAFFCSLLGLVSKLI